MIKICKNTLKFHRKSKDSTYGGYQKIFIHPKIRVKQCEKKEKNDRYNK